MGIKGLTTYINLHADVYLQNYRLHNTYLVIDGNGICAQLYRHDAKSNSCFGGDYDKYAYCVSNFFDELLKCNVTPLIITDGGSSKKKLRTARKRAKQKVLAAALLTPYSQLKSQLLPVFLNTVFQNVALQKGIQLAQSLFEADEDIASVARILNCPVLSCDSDFFIFDVMYIPYNTLNNGIVKNPSGDGYIKYCKMYKVDYFLYNFPGMDRTVLPLVAIILGNDYINRNCFNNFLRTLKLSKASNRKYNDEQRIIDTVLKWLQKQTLDTAIASILSKLDLKKREQILLSIEWIINLYLIASPKMLHHLGFSSDNINYMMQRIHNKTYKFEQNIYNLKVTHTPKTEHELYLICNDDDNDDQNSEVVIQDDEKELLQIAPSWFIEEFISGKFPRYFIDIIMRQHYISKIQVEDFSQPTCINISLKIISVIFRLLCTGITDSQILEYVARGNQINIKTYTLNCEEYKFYLKFPCISELSILPDLLKQEILNSTLGVNNQFLLEFPASWRLYIATAKYWLDEAAAPFKTNCHLYAVLFSMLYNIIDKKIGFHRSQIYFERKFRTHLNELCKDKSRAIISNPVENMSVDDALKRVDQDDCLLAAPFFLKNFVIDQSISRNRKKFHLSTVHSFSLFQNCLIYSSDLNALLGYPYEINHAEFFNGTLLYNLYNNFKSRNDIDKYISHILQKSPSLLQVFVSLLKTLKSFFTTSLENKINNGRRKRRRNHQSNDSNEDKPSQEIIQSETQYYDPNNPFAILKITDTEI